MTTKIMGLYLIHKAARSCAHLKKLYSMYYVWPNKSVENEICYFYPCQKPQNIRHEADWKEVRVFALLGSRCLTAADFRTSSQFARGQQFYEVAYEFLIPLQFHKIFWGILFCIKKLKIELLTACFQELWIPNIYKVFNQSKWHFFL